MRQRTLLACFLLVTLAGCLQAERGRYLCDNDGTCPDGLTCVNGVCQDLARDSSWTDHGALDLQDTDRGPDADAASTDLPDAGQAVDGSPRHDGQQPDSASFDATLADTTTADTLAGFDASIADRRTVVDSSFPDSTAYDLATPDLVGNPSCILHITPQAPATGDSPDYTSKGTVERWGLVQFGSIKISQEKRIPITLQNIGNHRCVIREITWRQSWTADNGFALLDHLGSAITLPVTLNHGLEPNQTLTLFASFAPTGPAGTSTFPNNRCRANEFCPTLTNTLGSEVCLTTPCRWGNGIDIVTGDGTDPRTADTTTDQSIVGGYAIAGTFSIGFMGKPRTDALEIYPTQLDFGSVTVGCSSTERTLTIHNSDSGGISVNSLLVSPASSFLITPQIPPTQVVQGIDSLDLTVAFTPTQTGNIQGSATLYVGDNPQTELTIPLLGQGTSQSSATDVFRQSVTPKADVLWVMDDSSSMSSVQTGLVQNFPSFFEPTVDYHIAVTTTLTCENYDCTHPDPMAGHYTSCPGNDPWVTASSADPTADFSCNIQVSDYNNIDPSRPSSDSAEGGLLPAKLFLSPPKILDSTINGGFLREDARLYIIAVSTEGDQSQGTTELYTDFFQMLKGPGKEHLITFSAIAGDLPSGCENGYVFADPGPRYKAVAEATGGAFHSVCSNDWTPVMQDLAAKAYAPQREFLLSSAAAGVTEVCVADMDLTGVTSACPGTVVAETSSSATEGWYLDNQRVIFHGASVPARGHWLRIQYQLDCL